MSHASSPKQQQQQQQNEEKEESLTTLLDESQRGELTLLIASAMVAMRRTITSSFDANVGITAQAIQDLKISSEDDKILNKDIDPATVDVGKIEEEKKLKQQREQELSAPQMKQLKEKSLHFFDDWRGKVIERVGEAVNAREQAHHNFKRANPPQSKTHAPKDHAVDPASHTDTHKSKEPPIEDYYPPIDTVLTSLPEESRILILHSTLLLLLSLENYLSPSRVLLLHLTSSLHLPLKVLIEDETKIAQGLLEAAKQMSGDDETQKKVSENASSRKWKVGLASVAGAALIGVTGGLAAPLVAAGVGSVMGGLGLGATAAAGYLGTVAGSTVIVGGLFGAYGGKMTGEMMDNYAREVSDFAFLPIQGSGKHIENSGKEEARSIAQKSKDVADKLSEKTHSHHSTSETGHGSGHSKSKNEAQHTSPADRRLRVTIGITGWLTSKEEVTSPWMIFGSATEPFALRFELEALLNLGNSLDAMVSSAAWGYAKKELIAHTVFAQLAGAVTWPLTLLKVSRIVDNPFSIAKARAEKAGEVLADALINKAQGERPVTLVGYSLGARVIYSCLNSLARRHAFGLIESAIFLGAPCPSDTADWRVMRSVVAGRLVNVYSTNDHILAFLYRTSSIQYGVAGLQAVEGIPSVENVDVSESVSGHLRYRYLVGSILKRIGYDDLNLDAVAKEEAAFQKMLQKEKEQSMRATAAESATHHSKNIIEQNPLGYGKEKEPTSLPPPPSSTTPQTSESDRQPPKDSEELEAQALERQVHQKTQNNMLESAWGYLPARLRGEKSSKSQESSHPTDSASSHANPHSQPQGGAQSKERDQKAGWTANIPGKNFLSGLGGGQT